MERIYDTSLLLTILDGDFTVDNQSATGTIRFTLGTDDNATSLVVRDNSLLPIVTFRGDGTTSFGDNRSIALGNSTDLLILHDGVDSHIRHSSVAVGDLIIDNQSVTAGTYMDLGTDTSDTEWGVRNNSGATLLKVTGDGVVSADVLNELTSAAGVTVENVLIKDGDAHFTDGNFVFFGTSDNCGLRHTGTGFLIQNGAAGGFMLFQQLGDGDFTIQNSDTDKGIVNKLGTATSTTYFQVVDSADEVQFKVNGAGAVQLGVGARDTSHYLKWTDHDDLYRVAADAATSGDFILLRGTDPEALDPARNTQAPNGIWNLITGDSGGTVAGDGSQFVWAKHPIRLDGSNGITRVEARIRIQSAITDVSVFFGLTDSTSLEEPFTGSADTITAVADDAIGFLFDDSNTTKEWFAAAVDGTSLDAGTGATGTAPTASTFQILAIEISADGNTANFFIDDVLVHTLSGSFGVSQDVNLYLTVVACSTTTTSKEVQVDWVNVSGVRW